MRIIREAVADGGTALNYVKATELLFNEAGTVRGVRLQDCERPRTVEATARIVINATGAWADRLRQQVGAANRLRPLRGSHLVFPRWRLPVAQVVNLMHPLDHRPVFLYPWEGVTIVGTTDLDHSENLDLEPVISPQEASYLMAAAHALFPSLNLTLDDVIATWAGVRPVIKTEQADPSKEPRDHVIWPEKGLLTVTGGKLTTFRVIARDALKAVREYAPDLAITDTHKPVLNQVSLPRPASLPLDEAHWRRLLGHYSAQAVELVGAAQAGELESIPGTPYLWAELRWAARAEGVVHLDDLLVRRLRLGLLLPQGGQSLLPRIRSICQMELGWDDARWEAEVAAYLSLWRKHYSLPDKSTVLDWRATPNPTQNRPEHRKPARTRWLIAILLSAAGLLLWRWRTKNLLNLEL